MESFGIRVLVILLGFSYIISLDAVPLTKIRSLLVTQEFATSEITHRITSEGTIQEDHINGKMELENNDYPGPGSSNRHTPPHPP